MRTLVGHSRTDQILLRRFRRKECRTAAGGEGRQESHGLTADQSFVLVAMAGGFGGNWYLKLLGVVVNGRLWWVVLKDRKFERRKDTNDRI